MGQPERPVKLPPGLAVPLGERAQHRRGWPGRRGWRTDELGARRLGRRIARAKPEPRAVRRPASTGAGPERAASGRLLMAESTGDLSTAGPEWLYPARPQKRRARTG